MSDKILIFAGTTEGRLLAEYLGSHEVPVQVCVATEYGEQLVEKNDFISVSAGRLDCEGMRKLIAQGFTLVIDATHPYATIVSSNLKEACNQADAEYMRLLRRQGTYPDDLVTVASVEDAVNFLQNTEGNILVATGSKELVKFTALKDYQNRVYARVLSTADVAKSCADLGFEGKNLICMQGPFCEELNYGMLKQVSAKYIVTKDSGKVGGFDDKIRAAKRAGVTTVLVGRPAGDVGLSYDEVISELSSRLGLMRDETKNVFKQTKVTFVSVGMGGCGQLTLEAIKALEEAEVVIGAERMLDAVKAYCGNTHKEYAAEKVMDFIKNCGYSNIAVAVSGDAGFYSAAKKLISLAEKAGYETQVISGISSVVYFCSKLKTSWEDVNLLSAHGKDANVIASARSHVKTFMLLSGSEGVHEVCNALSEAGMNNVLLHVGENLSYNNETITIGRPSELIEHAFGSLCVVLMLNEAADASNPIGISDECFVRGTAPMTKSEIRSLSVVKLKLKPDSVIYDIGAGTGSVSVEMALASPEGMVYAIEKEPDAIGLINQNKIKFGVQNLQAVHGTAPDAMNDLPAPTHAFIGGSSGNLKEIIQTLLMKNKDVRIVITAVTLETISDALSCITNFEFKCRDIVQLSVSKSREVGSYNLMAAQNPVYIFSLSEANKL